MGKKVKKIANVATFGAYDLAAKPISEGFKAVTGNAAAASEQLAKQQAAVAKQQETIRSNAAALSANSVVDNTASVVAGGTAAMAEDATGDLKRKQKQTLSSVLGIG